MVIYVICFPLSYKLSKSVSSVYVMKRTFSRTTYRRANTAIGVNIYRSLPLILNMYM